jgi:hypothetical protein
LQTQAIAAELPDMDTFLQEHGVDPIDGTLDWGDFHGLLEVEGDDVDPLHV